MDWFIIDGIGPFFRGYGKKRVNWSKIPFPALATEGPERREQWDRIAGEFSVFCRKAQAAGFNTITFDDLAHLATHPAHEEEVAAKIAVYREEFATLFDLVKRESGLRILLTSDVIPTTPAVVASSARNRPISMPTTAASSAACSMISRSSTGWSCASARATAST